MRAQEVSVLPQVDGMASVPMRRDVRGRALESTRIMEWEYSQDGMYLPGTSVSCRREYLGDSSNDNRSYQGWRPPERGRYPSQNGRLPDRGRYPERDRRPPRRGGYPREGTPNGGGLPNGGGTLMAEDPLMVEDPLMAMEDPLDPPVDKDHQALKDLPDQ